MNRPPGTSRAAAGLQAGMAGSFVLLAWLGLATLWSKHSLWWFTNLMATTFGGDSALQGGFDKYSPAGLALHLVQYSLLGLIFAAIVPARASYPRLLIAGVAFSIAYYYLMYSLVWKHVNPLIPLYSPDRQLLIGHVFYGFMLARLPRYAMAGAPATE